MASKNGQKYFNSFKHYLLNFGFIIRFIYSKNVMFKNIMTKATAHLSLLHAFSINATDLTYRNQDFKRTITEFEK